jgi:hypothetical protein
MYRLLVRKPGEAKKANKDTSVEGLKGIFNVLIAFTLKAMALDEPSARAAGLALGMYAGGYSITFKISICMIQLETNG